jgi:hypothetical protein
MVGDVNELLRDQEHPVDDLVRLLSVLDTSRQMHDTTPSAFWIFVKER